MADTSVVDRNADLMSLRRRNLYILNGQVLARLPRNSRLHLSAELSLKTFYFLQYHRNLYMLAHQPSNATVCGTRVYRCSGSVRLVPQWVQ